VVAVAAVLTWPAARLLGPRAWHAFAAFAALLAVVTVAVLVATRPREGEGDESAQEAVEDDEDDDAAEVPEAVFLEVEDSIDLHSFPPRDIPKVLEDYLQLAHDEGFREVRVIHGRGIGVQRERVRKLLADHPLVVSFYDAPPERGGWGATVVHLREREREQQ
jgi:DNA-nicking Smr family endonuclease